MLLSHSPLVTVVTPTYNRARYLPETIESVLGQGYPNLEYIVLDDGSTDNTPGILRRYGGIRVVRHPNMGETRTLNKGWQMAQGEYVIVINDDDFLLPGMIGTAVRFMEQRPELLMAYPDWNWVDENSQVIGPGNEIDYSYEEMVRTASCVAGPGHIMRRRAFSLEPGRDPRYRYVADFEYWLRLGLHGPFARLPRCLAAFRVHRTSTSVCRRPIIAEEFLALMEAYFARPDLPESIRRLQRQAMSSTYWFAAAVLRKDGLPYYGPFFRSFVRSPARWFALLARFFVKRLPGLPAVKRRAS